MLQIKDLSRRYPGGVLALHGVSLDVPVGIFGLLGPNGAGKSSLMRTLVALQLPDSGSIHLDGEDLLADPQRCRRLVGYLPQDFGVYPQLTARELLDQLAVYKGIHARRQRADLVTQLLEQVNLGAQADQRLGGYSGGMRQRFGVAQALIGNPRLLVVDEPTAGLDPAERVRLQGLLAELGRDRIVLLSTHIVEDVMALCSDIAVMNKGSVVMKGGLASSLQALQGQVWVAQGEVPATLPPQAVLLSQTWSLGQRQTRVLAHDKPAPGFITAEPELQDVYFNALKASA